ncbi:MAG: BolA family transcriptional regulator [Rhodoferax sp.]|jgi:BolA protein|nr:BolA family transcriptional regulator [Rhodoferax sp.]
MSEGPTTAKLDQRLRERLSPTRLEVLDESYQHNGHAGANGTGFGTHFRVKVASHMFTGLSRVARHRLVYDALQDFIDKGLHALAIETEESPGKPPV